MSTKFSRWIESAGLNLATTKMEAMLFTGHRRFSAPSFHLKREQIRFCTTIMYLGLWFDRKLTVKEHAKQTATNISRVMSNLGGRARVSVSFWQTLPRWSSYMGLQSGLMPSTPESTEEWRWFWPNRRLH